MAVIFRWDPQKARSNLRKHGISFDEAVAVFHDVLSVTIPDMLHSDDEDRFIIIGHTLTHKLVVVVHTDDGSTVGIISARPAMAHERNQYGERQT